jgi:hypothetical protein
LGKGVDDVPRSKRAFSFDELATELANGSLSRGRALKLMGAALVGGALASISGIAEAAPKPKPAGKKCKRDDQCSSGLCLSGVCSGTFTCRRCPEDCSCAVLADGSIRCFSCPGGNCLIELVQDCANCKYRLVRSRSVRFCVSPALPHHRLGIRGNRTSCENTPGRLVERPGV